MSRGYFGKNEKKWRWEDFKTTDGFFVSKNLMDWIIGQEKAIAECKLCLDEMIHRITCMKKKKWWQFWAKPELEKPKAKDFIPPTPALLLLGTQGTGKSLLGRALASHLNDLYKEHDVKLFDVISWKNHILPSEPRISIMPTPEGRKTVIKEKRKSSRKGLLKRVGLKLAAGVAGFFGAFAIFVGAYSWLMPWITNAMTAYGIRVHALYSNFFDYSMAVIGGLLPFFALGTGMVMAAVMIMFFGLVRSGNMTGRKGIGGAEATSAPKLLVDNSADIAKFIDATGHSSSQLFGSIAWDPYQTGGLGTPEHQRVSAGDVHRAFLGILYIDEIKNLHREEATTLLTVLEDGQLPVTLRSAVHGGQTAAMAVATEPIPCTTFFVAAGNMDSLPQIHPALMDRIYGYGRVVYMNDEMPNTVENRRKFVQFIAQEVNRFELPPFSRDACISVVDEARKKSGRNNTLTCIFRPMISIIKTASILAINERAKIVERRHVIEAVEEHCKTIQRQAMEKDIEIRELYQVMDPTAEPQVGQLHGMAVATEPISGEKMGTVLPVRASVIKCKKQDAYFNITGVKTEHTSWIQHSIGKVIHVVLDQLFEGKTSHKIHVDFPQQMNVDGPSAGIAMALAIISALKGKPLRQDVAVTGEINIGATDKLIVTPVGGVHAKIMAAQRWGFKKVLIPQRNYETNITPSDYKIKIVGCETLNDYMREMLCDS